MNRKEYTMTEKEITKALRWFAKVTTHCEHTIVSCPECEFHGFCTDPYSDDGICKMHECLTAAASLIESLQSDAASYQQVKKRLSAEGFNDLDTMITRYKQVMADANEIDIAKDEEMEQLRADLAVSQRRAESELPANEPLTPDELRQMDGVPVYVVDAQGRGEWQFRINCGLEDDNEEWTADEDINWDRYGDLWRAYRAKPERSET